MTFDINGGTTTTTTIGGNCEKSAATPRSSDKPWETRTGYWSKTKFLLKHCTIEPLIGLYIITSTLSGLCTQNLNLQKACRVNLGLSIDICSALENRNAALLEDGNKTDAEVAVQKLVADTMMWKTVLLNGIPLLLIVFVGSWSDRHRRRKPCMLIPIAGEMLSTLGLLLCTYFFYELPVEVTGLVESLPPAVTGGWPVMFMAVFSYIGDVSSIQFRTLRIGVANLFFAVAISVGNAVSGILFREVGFYGVYAITLGLHAFSITYGMIFIKEPKPEVNTVDINEPPDATSCLYFLEDFFSLSYIKEAIRVTFKKGQHNRKLRITYLMVVVIVVSGPLLGEISVMYMFTRKQFKWNEVDYSWFSTYSMVTNLLGSLFSVVVFNHMLKIDDALIGVMSCMSKILGGFVYAFATTDFVFYLGPLVEIINSTSFIAMRSIISKLVPAEELGKVNSIFGVCEAIAPVIYGPMYSAVYKATLNTFPGTFFLLGSAMTFPAVIIFLWIYKENKKENREKEAVVLDKNTNPGVPITEIK